MRVLNARRVALLTAFCALFSGAAVAQGDDSTLPAYRMAYASTIRCFVANGVIVGDLRNAGQSARAAVYEQKAKQSFGLAFQAGRKIGLSDEHVQADLDEANSTELASMIRDKAYFSKVVAECKTLGLM